MNILMIFRNDPFEASGAVTYDLYTELKGKGNNVKLLVNRYNSAYPEGIVSMETSYLFWKTRVINKLKKIFKLQKNEITCKRFHFHEVDEQKTFYSTRKILRKAKMKPDAIIILFAKNFVNSKNIYELYQQTGAPVYWMMYDTSPLTGGCHYSWECTGYQHSCGNCPGLYSADPGDITNRNMLLKKQYMDKTDVSIVLASEWQHQQAVKSSVFKEHPIHKIMISINPEIFKPVPNREIRKRFGIPEEKKVIFFGAKSFNDERKGYNYLIEALHLVKAKLKEFPAVSEKVMLLVAGEDKDSINRQLAFDHVNVGMLDNSSGVASAYQAADIFVCPSVEDAGPSMVNQSIMSGTPVVAFDQGVALDIVISGKTGYRARLKDSEDLAQGIFDLLTMTDQELQQVKDNCRNLALELFHPEVSINRWISILSRK